ncbi:MAG: DNA topoisomerase IV subunit A, partial [Microbacteriaceae bacterium]|nr:DNA topoisomerase IV subunit A [Microbacteriaceae bacterium]
MTATPAPPVDASPDSGSERIVDVELTDEMQGSFLEYAYSVIYSRALPDARDGLKPVQRRIIYQMSQMGLTPEKGHVKSARVVGDVMGKLHPHGDSAIYDALVRLSQSFSMRVPMIDGHGNFGSLDDGPAAARYTEARLMPAAIAMVENLDEDVVDFIPNYDNQLTQPSVLPAALPHLLINGASGIAVGMATNMAPHNVHEVVAAARHLIEHPEATLEDLMRFVPGPDLPTGGAIVGLEGITEAYATGRGSFKMRASVSVESIGPRKTGLVVTELPYLVGPERVIDKIKDAVNAKKLLGISDVTDLTDRHHGLRLVIAIKSGFDPEAVLGELYRLTPLEESFSINSVALVEGQPQTLGLVELLRVYVAHRLLVVTRRSQYRLTKRRERLHLVEGLLKAIVDIDEVIALIRSSDDAGVAKTRLQEVFSLSGEQTDYILELRLRRLTKISRIELESERDALVAEISHLTELLGSEELLRHTVSDEMASAAESFGTPRRTILLDQVAPTARAPLAAEKLEIADAPC